MLFSIIIPAFNAKTYLGRCIESLIEQEIEPGSFEVLVVDDRSTDGTLALARSFQKRLPQLRIVELMENGGPGHARNHGIDLAVGQWVLFLDSDDELCTNALCQLKSFIHSEGDQTLDAIGYDWERIAETSDLSGSQRVGRRDGIFLGNASRLIKAYLNHRMDGSVIFTAMRREMLLQHGLKFARGIHEDVDFIFRVYFHARGTSCFNQVLYRKRNHAESIIHQVTERHVEGYFRAWQAIGDFLAGLSGPMSAEYLSDHRYGSFGVVATRVREVVRHSRHAKHVSSLFQSIFTHAIRLCDLGMLSFDSGMDRTLYCAITQNFMDTMNTQGLSIEEKSDQVFAYVNSIEGKSWSCTDLHHSVFLRSNQVRTCCKRFFVGGEMRGDVVLLDVQKDEQVSPGKILAAKRELHQKLNSGVSCACDGCPFLEFKDWGALNTLDISYLSLEHHSVCNLKCTYCSDEYYGGQQALYDVAGTVDRLIDTGALRHCSLVVWGGGEPTIGKDFDYILGRLREKLPDAQQRILTNSVKPSDSVSRLLSEDKAQIVTSLDAGSDDNFALIRGRRRLQDVLKSLKHYADVNSDKVTIKYIFTQGNDSLAEIRGFVDQMAASGLLNCNFQISGDFKNEYVSPSSANAMIVMFGLLRKAGARVVYFDDLLRHRLGEIVNPADTEQIRRIHAEVSLEFIATPARYPEVIVWGAGQQAKYLVNQSSFFKSSRLAHFVDATPSKIGTRYLGVDVRDPSSLRESSQPVIIAAVQGYPLILQQYRQLGLPEERVINDLVI